MASLFETIINRIYEVISNNTMIGRSMMEDTIFNYWEMIGIW